MANKPKSFVSRFDEWSVLGDGGYESPAMREGQNSQLMVFEDWAKDGAIESEVTLLSGKETEQGIRYHASLLVRLGPGSAEGYAAGIGGYRKKYFIAKMKPGDWELIDWAGGTVSLQPNRNYRLRFEAIGSQLRLFDGNIQVLSTVDDSYLSGQFGLRTHNSSARFERVQLDITKPLCFVVMPFASELEYVYRTIQETIENAGLQCVRGDQRTIARPIIDDIRADIATADLVVVDFTGKNPNVYYEAGLADAWKKKWIVIAQSTDDLAFDVRHVRTILYSNTMGADVKFKDDLGRAIRDTLSGR
ncbi:hypothetical protein [Paludibaculum fermentans]|uniref:hypothetical protein n=1 Tax=Paludibaculum fermentans TaxID=1473598 RepID=UPI003EBAE55C